MMLVAKIAIEGLEEFPIFAKLTPKDISEAVSIVLDSQLEDITETDVNTYLLKVGIIEVDEAWFDDLPEWEVVS